MVAITKSGVDIAWSRKLVNIANQIIICKSKNKVVTNSGWLTVLV